MAGHGRCAMASRSHPLLPHMHSPSPPLVARRPCAPLVAVEVPILARRCAGLVWRMGSFCARSSSPSCARSSSHSCARSSSHSCARSSSHSCARRCSDSSVVGWPHLSSPPLLACLDLLSWLSVCTPCPHLLSCLVPCPLPHPWPLVPENVTRVIRQLSSQSSTR
jgi:hypothetical protein